MENPMGGSFHYYLSAMLHHLKKVPRHSQALITQRRRGKRCDRRRCRQSMALDQNHVSFKDILRVGVLITLVVGDANRKHRVPRRAVRVVLAWAGDKVFLRVVDDVDLAARMREAQETRRHGGHRVVLVGHKGNTDLLEKTNE